MRWVRRRRSSENGFSLPELLVVMILIGIIGGIALTAIVLMFRTQDKVITNTDSQQQAQIAIDQMSAEILRSDAVSTPTNAAAGSSISSSYTTGGIRKCFQWKYTTAGGVLRSRSWPVTWSSTGGVTAWRTLATGLLNNPTVVSEQPFRVNTALGGKTVYLTLIADAGNGTRVTKQSAASARNVSSGPNTDPCTSAPPE